MAVLKHTSPTAEPVAPSPVPAITVPSDKTSRAVDGASAQGGGGSNGDIVNGGSGVRAWRGATVSGAAGARANAWQKGGMRAEPMG